MRKFIKFTLGLFLVIFILFWVLITPIGRKPFRETRHFKEWQENFEKTELNTYIGDFLVGWASENITPEKSAPLAGYGKRRGKHYEAVNDSIYVKTIALQSSHKTLYMVSADLLFIPPKVVNVLQEKFKDEPIEIADIHFSAVHSHSSIGGWESSIGGEIFGGKYDPEIVEMLAEKFKKSILKAKSAMEPAKIYYSEVEDSENIRYRVKFPEGARDSLIRSLTFKKESGETAYLITYAAHSTTLSADFNELSRDYSGILTDSLKPNFAVFMAGAVASMGPLAEGDTDLEEMHNQGMGVFHHFKNREEIQLTPQLISEWVKVPLPRPTFRISKRLGLRPWVFKKLFGDYEVHIKITKIGNTLILGMPADFSGEIMVELGQYAKKNGLNLMVTSFNGGYIGYITHDRLYDSGTYETSEMSWYGYQVGGYFKEIAENIIDSITNGKLKVEN